MVVYLGSLLFDAQRDLLPYSSLEDVGLFLRDRMPIRYARRINGPTTFADGKYNSRSGILGVVLRVFRNGLYSGCPHFVLEAGHARHFPGNLGANATHLIEYAPGTRFGGDQDAVAEILNVAIRLSWG
jgi:hypothetical protein